MFRRGRSRARQGASPAGPPEPDALAGLREPWRGLVSELLEVRARVDRLLSGMQDGALRDVVGELAVRVDDELRFAAAVAARSQATEDLLGEGAVERVTANLKAATRRLEAAPADLRPIVAAEVEQLRAAYRSAHDLLNGLERTQEGLRRLAGELEAASFAAANLVLRQSGGAGDRDELRAVITRIDALHAALDDLGPA